MTFLQRCFLLLGLGTAMLVFGCDTYEQQNEFTERAFGEQPAGYTPMDREGNVTDSTEIDGDDWRTAPAYNGVIIERPAYPNPLSDGVGYINITVAFPNTISGRLVLCAFGPNSTFSTIQTLPENTGGTFVIQPGLVRRTGLVRFFIMDSATTECSTAREVISYGDVWIE